MERIEAVIRHKFGAVQKSKGKNGEEYIVRCPKCGRKKLYINPNIGTYVCFKGCMSGVLSEIMDYDMSSVKNLPPEPPKPLPSNVQPPGTTSELGRLPSDHVAIRYLKGRGFDPQELNDKFGVRYCSTGRVFARMFNTSNTLLFPIWLNGTVVGWQSRILYNPDNLDPSQCAAMGMVKDEDGDYVKPPKYFTSPGLEKGRVLFNYDVARTSDVVVICEGPLDAAAVGACGVATLGKGVTEFQARLIKAYWKVAVILLDPGDADSDMDKLEAQLKCTIPTVKVQLKGYKDAGEAPRPEIWKQIFETADKVGITLENYRIIV